MNVTIKVRNVLNGEVASEYQGPYTESTDQLGDISIIWNQHYDDQGDPDYRVHPSIDLEITVTNTIKNLLGVVYSCEKYDETQDKYVHYSRSYKYAIQFVNGVAKYSDRVVLITHKLKLEDASLMFPLKLKVEAYQKTGNPIFVHKRFVEFLGDFNQVGPGH
jgi:hypothetical protein